MTIQTERTTYYVAGITVDGATRSDQVWGTLADAHAIRDRWAERTAAGDPFYRPLVVLTIATPQGIVEYRTFTDTLRAARVEPQAANLELAKARVPDARRAFIASKRRPGFTPAPRNS